MPNLCSSASRLQGELELGLSKGDKGRACALLAGVDGHMVVAFKSGLVEKYTELGKRLWVARVAAKVG